MQLGIQGRPKEGVKPLGTEATGIVSCLAGVLE